MTGHPDAVEAFAGMTEPLVVALSGGADSAAMAWAAQQARCRVRCVHINHGLPASEALESAARGIAKRLGLALETVTVTPASSTEADLREVRYAALIRSLAPGELLITAHTADDQAETVLLHLLRGSGVSGLGGIPRSRGRIRRPLIEISREELRSIAVENRLPFFDDPENANRHHLRNRIRHELLPLLETYTPAVRDVLVRTAENLGEIPGEGLSQVRIESGRRGVRAGVGPLLAMSRVNRRRALRSLLTAGRGPYPPTRAEVDRAEHTLHAGEASEFASTGGRFFVEGPWLVFGLPRSESVEATHLTDGLVWGGLVFSTRRWDGGPRLSKWSFVHDGTPLMVRLADKDDRIAIRSGSKSVIDALSEGRFDAKHPVVARTDGQVVWIPGLRHGLWVPTAEKNYLVTLAEEDTEWAPSEP